jgi:hypothetical protein
MDTIIHRNSYDRQRYGVKADIAGIPQPKGACGIHKKSFINTSEVSEQPSSRKDQPRDQSRGKRIKKILELCKPFIILSLKTGETIRSC